MKQKVSWLAIMTIFITLMCFAVIFVGVFGYIKLSGRIRVLEIPVSVSSATDLQLTIDFLKDQMQLLIWLFGVIVAGAILTFLGLHTRKSIEERYDQKFQELLKANNDKIFEKQIVFIYSVMDDQFIRFRNEIRDRMYNTKLIQVDNSKDIPDLRGASIVIYGVPKEDDNLYEELANRCENEHIHCMLYCPGGVRLKQEFMNRKLSY